MPGQLNTRDYTEVHACSEIIIALRDAQRIARNFKLDALHAQITDALAHAMTQRDRLNSPRIHEADDMQTVALEWNQESTHRRVVRIPKGYQPADDPAIYDELANLGDPGQVRFERYGITCTPVENDPSAEDFITAAAHNPDDESDPQS
ncbi:Uncharacterised protein [Mycobacteroides abscessus subsp. abscessus]|uniref:hypothetical protein n=1 Tax=Mycobacteroides abscessus TaxID=36809 RepID=UPI0009A85601|nr:hypothetical protein [Mycobacteroides abscessus]SLI00937.1 Uncharacterised protein [Mycobacteroides abscessus subsp. abscessus]